MRLPGFGLFKPAKPAVTAAEKAPPIAPVVVAPDPDDKAAKLRARRRGAERSRISGRASTINTPVRTSTLGGGGGTTGPA